MRKILFAIAFLWASAAFGQGGGFIPLQTATNTLTGRPIANATITVCAAGALGAPCNPPVVNAIFSDLALTKPLSNPFLTDANGNYQFAAAPGTFTVSVTAQGFNGYSYQVTVPSTSPGAVQSVFGRTGPVAAQAGDYNAGQVSGAVANTTTVAGHPLSANVSIACADLTNAGSGCSSTGGLSQVSSLPATCTPGTSQPIETTVGISVGTPGVSYGAGILFYCDSTNHWSPVSQGSGASPIMGFYLSNQCPPSNSAQCFFTYANTQQANDCSWTSGSATITCASSHFVAADVGKRVMGWATCAAESSIITGNAATMALVNAGAGLRQMSIASLVSSTSVTVTFNADNTASGNTHCFVWGTPDDSGAAAVDTAIQNAPQCPKLFLAAGYYWFNAPHFFTQPTACANLGTIFNGSAANTVYAAGFEIEGRGTGNTVIFLPSDFPESVTCNNGLSGSACFVRTQNGRWSNFQITGGMNPFGTANPGNIVETIGPGSLDNFTCTNFGAVQANNTGVFTQYWDRWYQVNNSGCGGVGVATTSNNSIGSQLIIYKLRVENNATGLLHQNNGLVVCMDCGFLGSATGQVSSGFIQNVAGGTIWLSGGGFGQISPLGGTGAVGYLASTVANSTLNARDTSFSANGTNNFTSIKCTVACYLVTLRSSYVGTGTGSAYTDVAGSNLYDEGVNFFTGAVTVNGNVWGSSSITGQPLVTGNVAISACGTSTAGTFSGSSQKGQFTITFAGTPGTTCTATLTFPITSVSTQGFLKTPVCTWFVVGGTNAPATTIALGAQSANSSAVTFSGPTFTAANTMIVQYECINP